jgi:hypothetical protein
MKCPKCGYISFDHNEFCPKCNKNIAVIRDKMNMPSYKASPLSMLGALTGQGNDSGVDIKVQSSGETASVIDQESGLSLEDSQTIEAMEKTFRDSQEFEIELETTLDEGKEESLKDDADELELDLEDLPIEDLDIEAPHDEQKKSANIVRDPSLSPLEGEDVEETAVFDPIELEEETTSFDLDDLSRDGSGTVSEDKIQGKTEDDVSIDLEGLASSLEEPTEDLSKVIKTEDVEATDSMEIEDLELDLDLEGLEDKSS